MTSTIERSASAGGRRGRRSGRAPDGSAPVGGRPASRQRQLPWLALGLLLVVMSILGFALWTVQQAERVPVVVAAHPLAAGHRIERGDLQVVSVGADAGLAVLGAGEIDQVIGSTARGPIPAGTPLSPALVVGAADLVPPGQAVVGAALVPGELPVSTLLAGDRVLLVATSPPGTASGSGVDGEVSRAIDLGSAVVWSIEPLDGSGRPELFVSLLVENGVAAAVADAEAGNRLRLILIGSGP